MATAKIMMELEKSGETGIYNQKKLTGNIKLTLDFNTESDSSFYFDLLALMIKHEVKNVTDQSWSTLH